MKTITKLLIAGIFLPAIIIGFTGCEDDDTNDAPTQAQKNNYLVSINMKQVVAGAALELNTPNKPYTNKKGQTYRVSRLQYLISDITFNKVGGGAITFEGYHYVELADTNTLVYQLSEKIPEGDYSSIGFTFGFDEEDNINNAYADLNILNWNWPTSGMFGDLGGGYHYMRLEGNYDSLGKEKIFKTHMGTARNNSTTPAIFENNHLSIELANSEITVSKDLSFDLVMDINQWYENTYEWDFNIYNAPIMPIYDAQKRLNENGSTVFSIANIQE